jgi:hypothetical protein
VNPESNDPQLERVRREIRAQAAVLHERPLQGRTPPPASGGTGRIEQARLDYRIGDLTDAHYRAFIEQAFQALLKRAPDTAERDAQIALLAAGATKAEVLGNLRWSPEGRRIGVRVAGLLPRYASAKARRVPVLGYVLDLLINLAGLPQLARHQRASDALTAAGDEAAAAADHAITLRLADQEAGHCQRLDELAAARDLLRQRIDDLHAYAHELSVARDVLSSTLAHAEEILRRRIENLESITSAHGGRLDELAFLRQRVHAMNHWSHHLTEAFARIDTVAAEREAGPASVAAQVALAAVAADHGREARNIAWADALAATLPQNSCVLALASAGDWAALLGARGLNVDSAEVNPRLAEAARAYDVRVESVPAQTLLLRTADHSCDGLSVLALPALARITPSVQLLAEASRVLRAGGSLLLADAREPAALVDALLGRAPIPLAPELVTHALVLAGFIDIARVDGADGTPAWLARTPS